ncbi:MAG: VWA domain-containing protein [Deltaproteobacteria bacterium]|nr:VWA domain-containing protein [Deltaproteobacteria bacterium]
MGKKTYLTAAITIIVSSSSGLAHADYLVATRGEPLIETKHAVKVSVDDGLATITVLRSFRNEGSIADQVEMDIVLPWETVATGLRIKGKNRWYDGELMETEMAAVVYRSLTGYGPWKVKDPAILFWDDLGALGLWVFPVNPQATSTIEYTLLQPMDYRDGVYYMRYPALVDQAEMAVPTLSVVSKHKKAKVFINGEKIAQGKAVAIAKRLLTQEDADAYGPSTNLECEPDEWDEYWYEPVEWEEDYPFCHAAGEALVAVTAPKIDTVDVRYGAFGLFDGGSIIRLEIDAAKTLRPRPKKASVVFVVDGSHSFTVEGIDAALDFAAAFVPQLPDARYEVVLFRRHAQRLFGEFVPAPKWKQSLSAAPPVRLAAGNGSNLDAGLAMAAKILEPRKGPKRIIVISDTHMRSSYHNGLAHDALEPLDKDFLVHVVDLTPGSAGERAEAVRDDDHDLSPVALGHGGILVLVDEGLRKMDYREAARELVRPWKIEDFEILSGEMMIEEIEVPEVLPEGKGLRYMFYTDGDAAFVTLRGRIWNEAFTRIVPMDPEYGGSVVPALAFGSYVYLDLDDLEMMEAATAGGAVSPVTSYLSIEPGVRPSTEGFEAAEGGMLGMMIGTGFGFGGIGLTGTGAGGGGSAGPDYASILKLHADEASGPCLTGKGIDAEVRVRFECTYDEIADLDVYLDDNDSVRTCIEDALWAIRLPGEFDRHRLEYVIDLD